MKLLEIEPWKILFLILKLFELVRLVRSCLVFKNHIPNIEKHSLHLPGSFFMRR